MITRLIGLVKAGAYQIRFGKRLIFQGFPIIHKNVEIKITQGRMIIGKGFCAKPGAYFAVVNNGQLTLGKGTSFGRNCITVSHDSISIGDNVSIGPQVLIYDHDHKFGSKGIQEGFNTSPISIGDNCWIGAGVVILRGTVIGDGCVIGAGCVVKGNIPSHSLVTADRNLNICPIIDRREVEGE